MWRSKGLFNKSPDLMAWHTLVETLLAIKSDFLRNENAAS